MIQTDLGHHISEEYATESATPSSKESSPNSIDERTRNLNTKHSHFCLHLPGSLYFRPYRYLSFQRIVKFF